MTIIFNAILRIQYFPQPWKLAQIKMLHKPGKDPHQIASYRPISLLPVFSKILEKIIYYRIKTIIEIKKTNSGTLIWIEKQTFRDRANAQAYQQNNNSTRKQAILHSHFMDIEKAFGEINHESLLQTIRKQFPEQIHHLIKSYLSSRIFVIKIKDTYSEVKDIKAGVPQGSVLGLILYTLYTANIPTTTNSTLLTFADDTPTLVRHTNPERAVKLLQEHITKIEKWLEEKQIKTNSNKCNQITSTL